MRTNKRTTMLRSFTAAFALAVGMFTGFAQSTGGTTTEDDPYAKTYKWTAENGDPHESSLTETATDPAQIKALLATVWADKTIPGLQYYINKASGTQDKISNYTVQKRVNPSAYQSTYSSALLSAYEQYAPFVQNLQFSPNYDYWGDLSSYDKLDLKPDVHGMTVLLVEMTDDYEATEDATEEAIWKHMKSVTLLAKDHQHYVKTDKLATSGYLVNINRPLNKFFLIVKGDKLSNHSSYAPFYEGYEQISPIKNSNYVIDAYKTMNAGEKFPADHNCVTVFGKAHAMMMKGVKDQENIKANMLVYIPDGRFIDKGDGQYNHYKKEGSNGDLRPYFFIPTLTLNAEYIKGSVDENYNAKVDVNWESSIKGTTGDTEPERFRLLRSYDGTNWEEVPADQIIWHTPEASKDETTGYITHTASTVAVKVQEKQLAQSYEVHYKVYDRFEDTGFDEIESKAATVVIPGYEVTNPALNIKLDHRSEFKKGINIYTNYVSFVLSDTDDYGLKNENIGTDTNELNLKLYRFENKALDQMIEENGLHIASVVIKRTATEGDTDTYTATVTSESNPTDIHTVTLTGTGLKQIHQGDTYKGGDEWGYFIDTWTYNVEAKGKADGSTYAYRLFTHDAKEVKRLDGATVIGSTTDIRSNTPLVAMPTMDHACGFKDYALEEIMTDTDHHLEASAPQVYFTPISQGSDLTKCVIEYANGTGVVATAEKTAQGIWTLTNTKGEMSSLSTGATGSVAVKVDNNVMGNKTVMTIYRIKGDNLNSYGTPSRSMPYMPELSIPVLKLTYNETSKKYTDELWAHVAVSGDAQYNFKSHGYGIWHLPQDIVVLHDKNEIKELVHHKSDLDHIVDGVTFSYPHSNYSASNHEGHDLDSEVDAAINYERAHEKGSKDKPYSRWYMVRYYAQFHPDTQAATNESVAKAAANETQADQRYIILEKTAGARNEGGEFTTGVEDIAVDGNAVYPHVTDDIINITVPGAVEVFSVNGEEVAALPDEGHEGTDRTISLGHLNSGLYIVVVNGVSYKVVRR